MTDNLVDTGTDTLWEVVVIQGTRIRIPINTCLMTNRIKFIRSDSRFDMSSRQIKNLPRKLSLASSFLPRKGHTLQTFLIPSISSLVRILTAFSRTDSHWDHP